MKKVFMGVAVFLIVTMMSAGAADVDWTHLDRIHLDAEMADMAVSGDGELIFILLEGEIRIFSTKEDRMIKTIPVDKRFDRIQHSDKDNVLILGGTEAEVVERVQIDFVYDIDTAGLPARGPADAPVTIVVFDDYQCPYCVRLNPILDRVMERHPQDVKLVIKHFPLRMHKFAEKAAHAALAAGVQGKFWEYHDMVFENHKELNDDKFIAFAQALNLDMEKFKADLDAKNIHDQVRKDVADGRKAGVRGTPTVFINGKRLKSRSVGGFEKMIQTALEKID